MLSKRPTAGAFRNLFEPEFHQLAQAGLEFLQLVLSLVPPVTHSQVAEISGLYPQAQASFCGKNFPHFVES